MRLVDEIDVTKRFHRSVNVALDFERTDSLDGYVVSPLARDVTVRITGALNDGTGARAWTLIGPYGSGKSSLVAFLSAMICQGPAQKSGHDRLTRSWPNEAKKLSQASFTPLIPVLITGERQSLGRAILTGLRTAATTFWSGRGTTPEIVDQIVELSTIADAGKPVEDTQIIELMLAFAHKIKTSNRPGKGLFIVIDEMGKLLEWAAMNPERSDLYLLQRLAEAAARSSAPIGLLTVLHQDIAAYAASLTRSMRDEWTKIGGRFETISYLEPVHHIVRLLDGAITASTAAKATPAGQECLKVADDLTKGDLLRSTLPLAGTFPIHPLTALCIGPLFRTALGQNERSVFAFLNSHEPLGFQDWLNKADGSVSYRLTDLFDYSVHSTRALTEGTRAWSSAEFALSRLTRSPDPLDAMLVKTIAVITMVRSTAEVHADEATLSLATGRSEKDVKKSLARLKKWSVALHIKHRASWELWDGSDVDIDGVVAHHRAEILARGGIAELLEAAIKPTPLTASRHYIQTGTFRVLRVRYASTLAAAQRVAPQRGDGVLVIIVPDQIDNIAELKVGLDNTVAQPIDEPPRAMTVPVNVELFHEQGLDFLAVTQALRLTPELENDPIARRVLQERQLVTRDALQIAHEIACAGTANRPAKWRYNGEWHSVRTRTSSLASSVFDHAFALAPQIHNELINRAQISGAAASGRRKLMQAMLLHVDEPRLGITGHPPELSMYRSILERMGVHREGKKAWQLANPKTSKALAKTWARIGELLKAGDQGERLSFEAIAQALARPPYGVRAGVAPILIWAWYLVHQDEVFLYEEGSFIPQPDDALIERLLRQPKYIELQSAAFSGQLAEVALAIRKQAFSHLKVSRGQVPLRVVRQLVLFVKRLSPYALRTDTVSAPAKAVRTALSAAKDTVKLLVDTLPEALGIDIQTPTGPDDLAVGLANALNEIQSADKQLLDEIEKTLSSLFGFDEESPKFHREIALRTQALNGAGGSSRLTQRFIEQTAQLEPNDPESREIWLQSVGTTILGKLPRMWSDADVSRFQQLAEERVRSVLAAERLAFQMKRLNGRAGLPLMRIDYIDNNGLQKGQFGLVEIDTAEMDKLVKDAEKKIKKLLKSAKSASVSDSGVAYALLTAMMTTLQGTTVQDDG